MKTEISTTFGEQRISQTTSVRVYFFYITPTGAQVGLSESPHLKQTWGHFPSGAQRSDMNREMKVTYELKHPITIKMVCMRSIQGKGRESYHLTLVADHTSELIELTGADGFGGISFRGYVDLKQSGLTNKGIEPDRALTQKDLVRIFNYQVLSQPLSTGKKKIKTRKLIY